MADNKIDLTLNLETNDATKGVQKFGKAAEKSVGDLNESVEDLQKNVMQTSSRKINLDTSAASKSLAFLKANIISIGGAIAAAFTIGAVKNFFDQAIENAKTQENAINQLNNALARTGEVTESRTQDMLDFASSLQAVSTIGDEVTLEMLAIARNFTQTDDQAKKLVSTAADMSVAMGISLDSAVRQLGKSFGGMKGELGEVLPEIKVLTEEQLKSGRAIDILADKFAGAAKGEITTFSGAVTQAKNTFGDFQEEIGFFITKNPKVITAINEINKAFFGASKSIAENRDSISSLVDNAISAMITAIRSTLPVLSVFNYAWDLIKWSVNLVVTSFKNLIDVFKIAYEALTGLSMLMNGFVGEARKSGEAIKKSWDGIITRTDKLGASFSNVVKPDVFDRLNDFESALKRIQDAADKKPIEIKASIVAPTTTDWNEAKREIEKDAPAVEVGTTSTKTEKEEKKQTEELEKQNELLEKLIAGLFQIPAKIIGSAGAGAQGAQQAVPDVLASLFTEGGRGIGAIWGPIGSMIGQAVGSIMGDFIKLASGNKEEIAAKIDEFFDAIPKVLENIVENLPMIAEKIMSQLPGTVIKIAEAVPDIILGFIEGLDDLAYSTSLNSPSIVKLVEEMPFIIIKSATLAIFTIARGYTQGLVRLVTEKWNEAVRVMREKLLAIPTAVGDFFLGIYEFFKGLSFRDVTAAIGNSITNLGQSITDSLSDVGGKLKVSLPDLDFGPALNKLIDGIGSIFSADGIGKMVQALIDGFKSLFDVSLGKKSDGGRGPFEKAIGVDIPYVGLARGGVVPGGFPNDSYPSLLTSGETVVPADTTGNLFNLINELAATGASQDNSETNALLRQLISIMANQQKVIEVKLERDTLAKAIVSLNKDNRRLA